MDFQGFRSVSGSPTAKDVRSRVVFRTPHFLPQKGKANTDLCRGSTESADNINAPLTAKEISAVTATVQVTIVVVSHNQENNSNK